jgi:MSP (Major sperm protein) domain
MLLSATVPAQTSAHYYFQLQQIDSTMTELAIHQGYAAATSTVASSADHSHTKQTMDHPYYTAPTISFDDLSAREDFLLMLVSTASGSITQQKNQKRALTILQACGVQPEILDASDPSNALVRDELCELSGMKKGQYPQFFLVQGDQTEFFADFPELEHMNEEGTLAEWLGMEIPIKKTDSEADNSINPLSSKAMDSPAASKDYFYNRGKSVYGDDDGTETTHPETSHAGSSFDSHSVVYPHQQQNLQAQSYFDSMDQEEEDDDDQEVNCDFDSFMRDNERRGEICPADTGERPGGEQAHMRSPARDEEDTVYSLSLQQDDSPRRCLESSPRSLKEDSVIYSEMSLLQPEKSPSQHRIEHQSMKDVDNSSPKTAASHLDEDSLFHNVVNTDHERQAHQVSDDHPDADQYPHSLGSLMSCDESVDTTATASSIVTNSRMTSMDLDLWIQPSTDIHFRLTQSSEDTSRCTVTLSNRSMSYLPLAFKIQASQRRRYMIWPSVGVVKPQSTASVTVFLLDGAKQSLLDSFEKLGPAGEFRCTDTLSIEWCGVPTHFCNQLTDDHDQDLETLLSYWNSCHKNEGWACEQSYLRVRVSVDDNDSHHRQGIPEHDTIRPSVAHRPRASLAQKVTLTTSSSSSVSCSSQVDETHKVLQAEIENLRRKCEEITAERYLLEQQLEDVRERGSPSRGGAIHKFQLQQTMRCGHCLKVFRSDPNSLMAPIASQSCGHSICRNCCFRRSSPKRRSPKHSLSSDLLMCVGDMQSLSFDDDSCPICQAPSAFGNSKLHVNQSLCLVLKLLDS